MLNNNYYITSVQLLNMRYYLHLQTLYNNPSINRSHYFLADELDATFDKILGHLMNLYIHMHIYYQNNLDKQMLRSAYNRSKQKQVPFDLKKEDIVVPEVCPIFGFTLKIGKGAPCDESPTLDRIIPDKGYVKGNIIVVSDKANRIKNNASPEEIIAVGEFYKKLLEKSKNDSNCWI